MSDSTNTFQIIGKPPNLPENSQIIFEDQIGVDSFIFFEKTIDEMIQIKLVDLENLDKFDEPVYRAGKGSQPGQIVFEQIEIKTLKEHLPPKIIWMGFSIKLLTI